MADTTYEWTGGSEGEGLPWPTPESPPDGSAQIKALAEKLDGADSAFRPIDVDAAGDTDFGTDGPPLSLYGETRPDGWNSSNQNQDLSLAEAPADSTTLLKAPLGSVFTCTDPGKPTGQVGSAGWTNVNWGAYQWIFQTCADGKARWCPTAGSPVQVRYSAGNAMKIRRSVYMIERTIYGTYGSGWSQYNNFPQQDNYRNYCWRFGQRTRDFVTSGGYFGQGTFSWAGAWSVEYGAIWNYSGQQPAWQPASDTFITAAVEQPVNTEWTWPCNPPDWTDVVTDERMWQGNYLWVTPENVQEWKDSLEIAKEKNPTMAEDMEVEIALYESAALYNDTATGEAGE